MTRYITYSVYCSNISRFASRYLEPLLLVLEGEGLKCFWERDYVGGPHLKIRIGGEDVVSKQISIERMIHEVAECFIKEFPSPEITNYSVSDVLSMAKHEGRELLSSDLTEKRDCVISDIYDSARGLPTQEASSLVEDFLSDARSLACLVCAYPEGRLASLLRLYLLEATWLDRDLTTRTLSYKSHWEGFRAYAAPGIIAAIEAQCERNAHAIRHLRDETLHDVRGGNFNDQDIKWMTLIDDYKQRVVDLLRSGAVLTFQASTPEEINLYRSMSEEQRTSSSSFLDTMYSHPEFLMKFNTDHFMITARVLVNLLYSFTALCGATMLDRLVLTRTMIWTVEEHHCCDLGDILVARLVNSTAFSQ